MPIGRSAAKPGSSPVVPAAAPVATQWPHLTVGLSGKRGVIEVRSCSGTTGEVNTTIRVMPRRMAQVATSE
jgi:hypothetical protein